MRTERMIMATARMVCLILVVTIAKKRGWVNDFRVMVGDFVPAELASSAC
jgi:hypothetical protein